MTCAVLRSRAFVAQSKAATASSRHRLASVLAREATSTFALFRSIATGMEIWLSSNNRSVICTSWKRCWTKLLLNKWPYTVILAVCINNCIVSFDSAPAAAKLSAHHKCMRTTSSTSWIRLHLVYCMRLAGYNHGVDWHNLTHINCRQNHVCITAEVECLHVPTAQALACWCPTV